MWDDHPQYNEFRPWLKWRFADVPWWRFFQSHQKLHQGAWAGHSHCVIGSSGTRNKRGMQLDVEPKIGGFYPQKWMVKIMENPIKMDDLGVPIFLETPN